MSGLLQRQTGSGRDRFLLPNSSRRIRSTAKRTGTLAAYPQRNRGRERQPEAGAERIRPAVVRQPLAESHLAAFLAATRCLNRGDCAAGFADDGCWATTLG